MSKKAIIVGAIAVAVAAGIVFAFPSPSDTADLDVERMHGTVSTTMASPVLGDPDAPVTIIEFGDYQCHQCYNWFHNTKPAITRDYIDDGKANLVFVDLAFLGRDSMKAAQATYCAEDQGRYWEYHDMLYVSQEPEIDGGWADTERLKAFAFVLGLDPDLFDSCLDSGKYSQRVQYNIQQANNHNIRGTPGFIIVGPDSQEDIRGAQPFSVFKAVLDQMT